MYFMDEMRTAIKQLLSIKTLPVILLLLPVSTALPTQNMPNGADDDAFVKIPAGEFSMGSESGEDNEKRAHRVKISKGFETGKYEVTQAHWEALMGMSYSPLSRQKFSENKVDRCGSIFQAVRR